MVPLSLMGAVPSTSSIGAPAEHVVQHQHHALDPFAEAAKKALEDRRQSKKEERQKECLKKLAAAQEVSKSQVRELMPALPADGSNPAPVHCNGGVVYSAVAT